VEASTSLAELEADSKRSVRRSAIFQLRGVRVDGHESGDNLFRHQPVGGGRGEFLFGSEGDLTRIPPAGAER
jgi:hypothetical protein